MKNIEFLLAEQVGASSNPLKEISDLRNLLDSLERVYSSRKNSYIKPRKKRWVIRWKRPTP
jgi:hypothetical protein